ncbi:2038_t:CDS:2, partial [Entrophospora sp. SA101]
TRALSKQSNPEGLPCTNNSLSFFLKIPAKTQIEILVHAAELAIQCENEHSPLPVINPFRQILG